MKMTRRIGPDKVNMGFRYVLEGYLLALQYLWVLVIILNGNSILHATVDKNYHLLELSVGLTYLLLVSYFLIRRVHVSRNNVLVMVFVLIYCTIYLSVMQTKMNAGNYIKLWLLGAPAVYLLFAELNRQKYLLKLMHKFSDVICVLAAVAVVLWYLCIIVKVIEPNMYTHISWGHFDRVDGVYGIFYAFQMDTTFFPQEYIFRNSGIFAEAPMFNLWLDIALAIEVFLKPRISKWRIVLLVITILTTMSVTGIIFMLLCAVLWAILNYRNMSRAQKGFLMIGGLIGLPAIVMLLVTSLSLKGDTQSFEMRLSDYVGGLKLWMDYPMFGAGFGNLSALQPYVYSPEGTIGFSNSVMAVLGTGGVWTALLYYLPHITMTIPRVSGSKRIACFGICMLFLFCTTIFFARYIGMLIAMFGLTVMTGSNIMEH